MFRNKKDTGDKTQKQYETFKRRLNASKHAFWFELLNEYKKFSLYSEWVRKKSLVKKDKISFRKFIYEARKKRKYMVPKDLIRESLINKILK